MSNAPREVLFVGSVPARPVAQVFEKVSQHVGELVRRIPDGEMMGWLREVWRSFNANRALTEVGDVKLSGRANFALPIYGLKRGLTARDLVLGPYGYAENAVASYAVFKELREQGRIAPGTRLQVCIAGPGTMAFPIQLPGRELLPIACDAIAMEIEKIVASIPHADLTIHLDVAMEAEHEEWLRRPNVFDTPVHRIFDWTHKQMADAVAAIANRIPVDVELGFHICSIWHHYPDAGQDNTVLVDTANLLSSCIERPIAYFHIPVIPEHISAADYAPFANLRLKSGTKLFLGLINLADGVEGARRRIALAQTAVSDFGVSFFCGLGLAPRAITGSPGGPRPIVGAATEPYSNPGLRRATPEILEEVLDLHRDVALLA